MRDSRTAISQNGTVQRLTYLTIGYLPIALMAVSLPALEHPQEICAYNITGTVRYPA
jgi:hypothetical protein